MCFGNLSHLLSVIDPNVILAELVTVTEIGAQESGIIVVIDGTKGRQWLLCFIDEGYPAKVLHVQHCLGKFKASFRDCDDSY